MMALTGILFGIAAICLRWPTWSWAIAFAIAGICLLAELGTDR